MKVKINHDYFSFNSFFENIRSFVLQGHVASHVIDRIKWYYCPRFFITPPSPTHLEVEASSACQMRCPMCKRTDMVKKGIMSSGSMAIDLYKKIIDEASSLAVYSIKLSWRGEPLLNKSIVEMVRYAKEKGIKDVAFLTNGEQLREELSRDLIEAGLDWLSISADGIGDIYNSIRKPAIFEETFEKVSFIRKVRDDIGSKKPLIRVQSVHSAIRSQEEEFFAKWKGVADRINFIADQIRSIDKKDYRHDPEFICPSPWQRMCIAWNGKVVQCYGDYMEGNVLGDLNQNTLKEIWDGDKFNRLREQMKSGRRLETEPCKTCSDGGVIEGEDVIIEGRKVKAGRYVEQSVDVRKMDESSAPGTNE